VKPSKIIQFHEETGESLKESIDDIEKENLILKEKVKELEKYFLPRPLFIEPITTIQPLCSLEDVPETSSRLKGSSSLLVVIRKYIGDSIKKRIALILEIWELATCSTTFSTRVLHFKEYLQKYLENDEGFYKEVVGTFLVKVLSLSDLHGRDKNIPSKTHMKQINACWLKIIKFLREMLSECDVINTKRGDVFLKLVDLTKELDIPHLIMDTMLLSKEKLQEQLEALKVSWASEFNDSIEYSEEEVEIWLV
jgi:hypothetical protein